MENLVLLILKDSVFVGGSRFSWFSVLLGLVLGLALKFRGFGFGDLIQGD
jgi:hypothetical protein